MSCTLTLQMNQNYDPENNAFETAVYTLPNVEVPESAYVGVKELVDIVKGLPESYRRELNQDLIRAKKIELTEDMVKNYNIIGNTTLTQLMDMFPALKNKFVFDGISNDSKYNIITGTNFKITNVNYNGRVSTKNGEVFIIKDEYAAVNFLKYIQAKQKIEEAFGENGAIPKEINKGMLEKLEVIRAHYKDRSYKETLLRYINEKHTLHPFTPEGTSDSINPKRVLFGIVNALLSNYGVDENSYTTFEAAINALRPSDNRNSYEWRLPKKELYDLLVSEKNENMSYEDFNKLSREELQQKLEPYFLDQPNLRTARVKKANKSETVVKTSETQVTEKVPEEFIQQCWDSIVSDLQGTDVANFPDYKSYIKEHPDNFVNLFNGRNFKYTDINGEHDIQCTISTKGKKQIVTATYTYTPMSISESDCSIVLEFPDLAIGSRKFYGYNTQTLFSPVSNDIVNNGMYKGYYLYEGQIGNKTMYAVSRNPVNSATHSKLYLTVEAAMKAINSLESRSSIKANDLLSLKQSQGDYRNITLDQEGLHEWQIVSNLNIPINPTITFDSLPILLKQLLRMSLPKFRETLSKVSGIENIVDAQQASALIYLLEQELRVAGKVTTNNGGHTSFANFTSMPELVSYLARSRSNNGIADITDNLITQVKQASRDLYFIEKIDTEIQNGKEVKVATVRKIQNETSFEKTNSSRVPSQNLDQYIGQTLRDTCDFFAKAYGLQIRSMSKLELIQYSTDNNLGIENHLESIKAFIHNGEIIINTYSANASDLFHEVSHILLGVLKVRNYEAYRQLLTKYMQAPDFARQFATISSIYSNLAQQDRVEETVCELIAKQIMNNPELIIDNTMQTMQINKVLSEIFDAIQQQKQIGVNNGLGFNRSQITEEENNLMQRKRLITNFIEMGISSHKIIERC